jgi:hypothetical protein
MGFNSAFKGLIKPVLMFGAETWVLSKADELRPGVFERKTKKEESIDLSVKGQHGDQDIMKNCIICMMGLTW